MFKLEAMSSLLSLMFGYDVPARDSAASSLPEAEAVVR